MDKNIGDMEKIKLSYVIVLYLNHTRSLKMKNRYSMFVGRFQPFHDGHKWLIEQRLKLGKKICIAVMDIHDTEPEKNPFKTEDVSFIESLSISFNHVIDSIGSTFKGIFELITGQLSAKAVSGPIGIAKISGEFASKGFIPLLSLMAILSISLGVINILPFPGLDGGHALIAIIEKLKGSKISAKTQVGIQQFGMLVLMSLFLLIILKDLGIL